MGNSMITELKKHLGPGLGLRKNKYLVEIPAGPGNGFNMNILCQSAGLPERNISTTEIFHKGRKYQVRGETDFIGEWEISIIDDSAMTIRQAFDAWLYEVDNSKPGESGTATASGAVGGNLEGKAYQRDITIWQMKYVGSPNGVKEEKVYGYVLQNCYPKSLGIVTLADDDTNTLSQFSVNFAFSEFEPKVGSGGGDGGFPNLSGVSSISDIQDKVLKNVKSQATGMAKSEAKKLLIAAKDQLGF